MAAMLLSDEGFPQMSHHPFNERDGSRWSLYTEASSSAVKQVSWLTHHYLFLPSHRMTVMQEGRQQRYTIPCPCRIIELQWRSKNRFRDHSDRIAKESHFCSLFKCVHIKIWQNSHRLPYNGYAQHSLNSALHGTVKVADSYHIT